MTKRLIAVAAAAVLALGMIAFTPTPTSAGGAPGRVVCGGGDHPEKFSVYFFGFGTTVRDAIGHCIAEGRGRHPVAIEFYRLVAL